MSHGVHRRYLVFCDMMSHSDVLGLTPFLHFIGFGILRHSLPLSSLGDFPRQNSGNGMGFEIALNALGDAQFSMGF